jgi:eukaryotic-like serine/threonine-protein kinase
MRRLAMRSVVAGAATALFVFAAAYGAQRTTIAVFTPWTAHGLSHGMTVSAKAKGSCFTHSLSANRSDAWRCTAGDDIYDPCFAPSPPRAVVACAQGPFARSVVLVSVEKPLGGKPNSNSWVRPPRQPWGLRLANGDTCVFMTGATEVVAGQRLNYACTRSGWIVGHVDRSEPTWTVATVASPTEKQIKKLDVEQAVF